MSWFKRKPATPVVVEEVAAPAVTPTVPTLNLPTHGTTQFGQSIVDIEDLSKVVVRTKEGYEVQLFNSWDPSATIIYVDGKNARRSVQGERSASKLKINLRLAMEATKFTRVMYGSNSEALEVEYVDGHMGTLKEKA